jgi:signal peptidase I
MAMAPTIMGGDRILANKLAYRVGAVQRGDVVAFKAPPSAYLAGERAPDYVKRVVGIPGDRVEIKRGGGVYVNGVKQKFGAMSIPDYDWPINEFGMPAGMPYLVPEGAYFVLGDNCNTSNDSHRWTNQETGRPTPELPRGLIRGKVTVRLWPPARVGQVG